MTTTPPAGPAAPLVRLGIRVRRERAEEALAALLPLLGAGAEETEPAGGDVEYALYAPLGELPSAEQVRALAGDALLGAGRALLGIVAAPAALVGFAFAAVGVLGLTAACGFGLVERTQSDGFDDEEDEPVDSRRGDDEPGFAIVSLGALAHAMRSSIVAKLAS